jgi:hypothetical protein
MPATMAREPMNRRLGAANRGTLVRRLLLKGGGLHGSPVDAVAGGDVGDVRAIEHLSDREVALLNHRRLRKHPEILLGRVGRK